jgi:hypothetical protein
VYNTQTRVCHPKKKERIDLVSMSYGGSKMDMSTDQKGPTGISSGQDLSKRQGLIAVNDLTYVLEPDLSVASNKTHKTHYFQNSEYTPGQNAICILNSGADYIDTRRSWLQFDVTMTAAATLGKNGSGCNFIKQITVSTRSGDVLCQLFDFNLMSNMLLPLTYDRGWFDTVGQGMCYGQALKSGPDTTNRVIIPMYVLTPLFAYGRLMPAMLMSGLRIEILWEDGVKAVSAAAGAPTYTVKNPQFCLSSVQLSDSIQRALNELSATNGLEIVYCDYERDSHTTGGALTTLNMEIRKSCSRALKAFARIRTTSASAIEEKDGDAAVTNEVKLDDQKRDSFAAETTFPVYEYQWRLGSLYFPQQPVRSPDTVEGALQTAVTSYTYLLEAIDKYHGGSRAPHIPFSDFSESKNQHDSGVSGSYKVDSHSIGVTLERSTMFNLAGIPVNNSRVLALSAKLRDTNGDAASITSPTGGYNLKANSQSFVRQADVFLKYVRLARVFLNNVEVEQ